MIMIIFVKVIMMIWIKVIGMIWVLVVMMKMKPVKLIMMIKPVVTMIGRIRREFNLFIN